MNLKLEQERMRRRGIHEKVSRYKQALLHPTKRPSRKFMTYFVLGELTGLVKIGRSFDPKKRLLDLQVGSPDKLRLIRVVEGDREKEFHLRFKDRRRIGEWFFISVDEINAL